MIAIDMEMPKKCGECRFFLDDPEMNFCAVQYDGLGYTWIRDDSVKHEDCPLKELKPCFKGETTDGEEITRK